MLTSSTAKLLVFASWKEREQLTAKCIKGVQGALKAFSSLLNVQFVTFLSPSPSWLLKLPTTAFALCFSTSICH